MQKALFVPPQQHFPTPEADHDILHLRLLRMILIIQFSKIQILNHK